MVGSKIIDFSEQLINEYAPPGNLLDIEMYPSIIDDVDFDEYDLARDVPTHSSADLLNDPDENSVDKMTLDFFSTLEKSVDEKNASFEDLQSEDPQSEDPQSHVLFCEEKLQLRSVKHELKKRSRRRVTEDLRLTRYSCTKRIDYAWVGLKPRYKYEFELDGEIKTFTSLKAANTYIRKQKS